MWKRGLLAGSMCLLVACAGNPPEWWNPGGVYSPKPPVVSTVKKQPLPAQKTHSVVLPVPTSEEQPLYVADDSYEEMPLTPLYDDAGEEESGDSSAELLLPARDVKLSSPSILAE